MLIEGYEILLAQVLNASGSIANHMNILMSKFEFFSFSLHFAEKKVFILYVVVRYWR